MDGLNSLPMTSYTVQMSAASSRSARNIPVVIVRRTARASVVVGVALLLLSATAIVLVVQTWLVPNAPFANDDPLIIVAIVLLIPAGWRMVRSGRNRVRANKLLQRNDEVPTVAPYAFSITSDTVEFPGDVHNSAESWPRAETTGRVHRYFGEQAITLERPGSKRRYLAKELKDPLEQVLRALAGGNHI